jgi:alkanesulfonate monooxygenase
MRGLAAAENRTLRFGMRVHTLSRDTSEAAWAHAQWLLDGLDPATIAGAQAAMRASESTGQQRMSALRSRSSYTSARELEVHPGLWTGVGLVRGGAGTALVGSHDEVAELIATYHRIGVDELILSGYPHVEEARWFAEGVRPRLAERGLLADAPVARVAVPA